MFLWLLFLFDRNEHKINIKGRTLKDTLLFAYKGKNVKLSLCLTN
jgi:hypothetical protein